MKMAKPHMQLGRTKTKMGVIMDKSMIKHNVTIFVFAALTALQAWYLVANYTVIHWAIANKPAVEKIRTMQSKAVNEVVDNLSVQSKN